MMQSFCQSKAFLRQRNECENLLAVTAPSCVLKSKTITALKYAGAAGSLVGYKSSHIRWRITE